MVETLHIRYYSSSLQIGIETGHDHFHFQSAHSITSTQKTSKVGHEPVQYSGRCQFLIAISRLRSYGLVSVAVRPTVPPAGKIRTAVLGVGQVTTLKLVTKYY